MTTFKQIENIHKKVFSEELLSLDVSQLESLLMEIRTLQCNPKFRPTMEQIKESEARVSAVMNDKLGISSSKSLKLIVWIITVIIAPLLVGLSILFVYDYIQSITPSEKISIVLKIQRMYKK
jgi:hypothetical protein